MKAPSSSPFGILFGDFVCVSADVLCHIKVVVVSSVVGGIQSDMIEGFLTRCLFHQCHPANSDRRGVYKDKADSRVRTKNIRVSVDAVFFHVTSTRDATSTHAHRTGFSDTLSFSLW